MSAIFALCLPAVILACGFALDVGMMQFRQGQIQNAADAAVIAAELQIERNNSNWATEAKQEAAVNGFTDGSNNVTVTVVTSPFLTNAATLSPYVGRYDVLQVRITQQMSPIFMSVLNVPPVTIAANAVAQIPTCMYFLNQKNAVTYTVNESSTGGNSYDYGQCPMYINGNLNVASGSWHQAAETSITGASGSSILAGRVKEGTVFGAATVSDPLASVTSPSFSSCNHTSYSASNTTVTLNPGTYCGTSSTKGMTISNSTVTLNAGTYIITGGAQWSQATVTGTGVTLFFTKGNGAQYGQFVITTLSTINLQAPTSGSLAGILIFADRNWVNTAAQDFIFNSGTFNNTSGNGILYLPAAGLEMYNGTYHCLNYCPIIADNMYTYNETMDPWFDFSILTSGNPFRKTSVLAE